MKKSLSTLLAIAILTGSSFLAAPCAMPLRELAPSVASAAGSSQLDPAEQKALDDFFTVFSASGLRSFRQGQLTNDDLLLFAVNYNLKYNKNLKNMSDTTRGIPLQDLTGAAQKYFGMPLTVHDMNNFTIQDNLYIVPKATSDTKIFSTADSIMNNGDGTYLVNVTIFMGSSAGLGTSPIMGSRFRALITKTDDGYNLKEYILR